MEKDEGKEEIAVIEDSIVAEEGEKFDAPQIPVMQLSIHALAGTAHPTNTFTLKVQIGKHWATALFDSGNDTSFISAKFAIKTNTPISTVSSMQVATANGKKC